MTLGPYGCAREHFTEGSEYTWTPEVHVRFICFVESILRSKGNARICVCIYVF